MAQKKMGRPTLGEKPMKQRLFVLLDDKTREKLSYLQKELGTTRSDIVRKGIERMYNDLKK